MSETEAHGLVGWLMLNTPLDTKQVILGMLFLANLLASG